MSTKTKSKEEQKESAKPSTPKRYRDQWTKFEALPTDDAKKEFLYSLISELDWIGLLKQQADEEAARYRRESNKQKTRIIRLERQLTNAGITPQGVKRKF